MPESNSKYQMKTGNLFRLCISLLAFMLFTATATAANTPADWGIAPLVLHLKAR